ncbi:helix-turn-helix domain-containing protein [Roseomonas elaeocarpi]|uniref:Helix-turn-helix domain-containing protein n=1 Tax=Roseomonas elaeocarpi TaxID=907779 RepID=A0ABV6JNK6_9PROT
MASSLADGAAARDMDARLAERLVQLRTERGWSLEQLAERSGVSRATLSRMERNETSPTTALLGRLCTAYNKTMSRLLVEVEAEAPSLLRAVAQPVRTDGDTGFRRRDVSPPMPGLNGEMIEGELPPDVSIPYEAPPAAGLEHHLWLLAGRLEVGLGPRAFVLQPGDSLRFRLFGPSRYVSGPAGARYVLAMVQP